MVSGVRSSCDRLSMNSVRICWRRRSSDDVLEDEPQAARRGTAGANHEPRPVGAGRTELAGGRAGPETGQGGGLDLGVEEDLDDGPSDEGPRVAPEERAGRPVRGDDAQAAVHLEDALRERIDERLAVTLPGGRFGVEPVGSLAQGADGRDRIAGRVGRERGDGRQRPATVDAEERGRAADEQRHDRDQPAIHDASIAQALPGAPASGGPDGGPGWRAGRRG